MKLASSRKAVVAVIAGAGLLLGGVINAGMQSGARAASPAPDATPLAVPSPVQLSNAFSQLAKQVEPSVVQIESTIEQKTAGRRGGPNMLPFGDDEQGPELFRRFFGDVPFGQIQPPQPRRQEASGSGFIVDSKGYILTNNHVVDGASRVKVKLMDDPNEYTAKVIGTDPELDLAVLKIDAGRPLQPVKIGNSDSVQVGDWAVAIGSPFGLEATVTAGIISAKGRALGDRDHQLQRFLQTDAAINPGNSGGPLLDIRGEAIGVNTMIATNTGAFQGVGFALPINLAVESYNQIIKTGKVSRGAIGILFDRNQRPELLKVYGGKDTSGVFVTQVTPGTPAEEAGMRQGDIITSYNGKPVKDGEELVGMVSQTPVGSSVPVTVLRDGKPVKMTLKIADRAEIIAGDTQRGRQGPRGAEGENKAVKFGLSVRNLSPGERQDAKFEQNGVLVTEVDSNSFADELGIRQGDIISAVNRQQVNSVDDLKRIAAELKPGDPVAFKVMRNTAAMGMGGRRGGDWQPFFVAGTLPQS